jgi:nucleoside 2-deoxyribosyltransferase
LSKIIYLAIPYTWDPAKSFEIANKVSALLMQQGYTVFSPISHSHPIADFLPENLRLDQQFWMYQDLPILSFCDEVWMVIIGDEGLELIANSRGCQSEIREAKLKNKPIKYYRDE